MFRNARCMSEQEAGEKFPIGTKVRFYPIAGEAKYEVAEVRSRPWALGHSQVVLAITGRAGGVAVEHLQSEPDLWRAAKHSSPALDENRELLGEVTRSLKAMLDAFGGDVPDWLSEEFAAAENAVEKVEGAKPSSDPEMEP